MIWICDRGCTRAEYRSDGMAMIDRKDVLK